MRAEIDHSQVITGTGANLCAPPAAGYWAMKLAKNAPEVGAAIIWVHTTCDPDYPEILMERSPFPVGYINGEVRHWDEILTRRRREITRQEYEFLLADRQWAASHAPYMPEARPNQAVNLNELQPLF